MEVKRPSQLSKRYITAFSLPRVTYENPGTQDNFDFANVRNILSGENWKSVARVRKSENVKKTSEKEVKNGKIPISNTVMDASTGAIKKKKKKKIKLREVANKNKTEEPFIIACDGSVNYIV